MFVFNKNILVNSLFIIPIIVTIILMSVKVLKNKKDIKNKIEELAEIRENIAKERITLSPQLLLEFARRKERENCYVDVNELVPMYMRKSQAEESLKAN